LEEQGYIQGWNLYSAEEARRRGCAAPPGEDRREADDTLEEAGGLSRSCGGWALQGGTLPVLTNQKRQESPDMLRGFSFFDLDYLQESFGGDALRVSTVETKIFDPADGFAPITDLYVATDS
jgi:hypothetical protein